MHILQFGDKVSIEVHAWFQRAARHGTQSVPQPDSLPPITSVLARSAGVREAREALALAKARATVCRRRDAGRVIRVYQQIIAVNHLSGC